LTGRTVVLVDGENIDATLGSSLFGRRPLPEERPRWERVIEFAEARWQQPALGLFFLNASGGTLPTQFVQALLALRFRPVPLAGRDDEKVVDIGIQRTMEALVDREDDVLLVSHDGDFAPYLERLVDGRRRVGVIALREYLSTQISHAVRDVFDLEDDVKAFNSPLPRVRIIALADFDPEALLR
jgi:putative heme uptake system protein